MQRTVTAALALAVILAACGRGGDQSEPATTVKQASTTTAAIPTTTRAAQSTTTTEPIARVTTNIEGADEPLAAAVAAVYEQALNPGQSSFIDLPPELLAQFSDRDPMPGSTTISGSVSRGRILDTDIAVYTADDDLVLLAGEPDAEPDTTNTWDVVGAKLASLDEPGWYGPSPRLVLALGSDARPGQSVTGFRADSVHIIATRPDTGQGSIVGIPRDAWVEAPYGGRSKLTNTMASRGPDVVLETVRNLTGLDIEGYLITGFAGFESLIDAYGGFTIDVPYGMADPKSNAYFSSGVQEFTGAEALAFSRNRTDTPRGDFGRSLNHGIVMLAVMPQVQEMGIDELPELLEILTSFVITDLTAADLLAIAAASYDLDPELMTNIVAPGRVGSTSGGASVVFLGDSAVELFEDASDGVIDGDY